MRVWIWLLVGVLLSNIVAADPLPSFSTSFFTASETTVSGFPALMDFRASQLVPLTLEIEANSGRIEMESAEYVNAGGAALGIRPPERSGADFGAGHVSAAVIQPGNGIFVVPLDGTLQTVAGKVAASIPTPGCREQPLYFPQTRSPLCIDLDGASRLQLDNVGALEFSGHFQVFLWGWNGTISDPSGSSTFWSGEQPSLAAGGLGPTEYRHVMLDVHGNLTIASPAPLSPEILFSSATIVGRDIQLSLASGQALAESATIGIARQGSQLVAVLQQGEVHLKDGTVVRPSSDRLFPWGWLLVAIGAVVAAPPAIIAGRRTAASRHLQQARDSIAIENYHSAARHAEAAMSSRAHAVPAGVIGAIALIRADDLEDADYFLESLRRNPQASPAAVLYLEACLEAKAGRKAVARGKLVSCFAIAPAYESEARANPILEGVLP